jgi:hypothetical protein
MMTDAPVKKRGRRRHDDTPRDKPDRVEPKNLGGRPPKYTDAFADQLVEYFDTPPTREVVVKDKQGNETTQVLPGVFPTLAMFAANIGVCRDTLHDWATAKNPNGTQRNPRFSDAYKRAKALQEANLVEGTMAGAYNSTFAIFTAKNVLGWRDKVEQEITGKDGAPIGPTVIGIQFMNPDGTIANIDGQPIG